MTLTMQIPDDVAGELSAVAKLFQPDGSLLSSLGRQHRVKENVKSLLGDRLYAKLWALVNRQEPEADASEGRAK